MFYGLPDLNYTLEFDEELELLRSTVKVAMDTLDNSSLVRASAKRVVEACKLLKNAPRVVTEAEVFELAADHGVEAELRKALIEQPEPSVEEVVQGMINSVPSVKPDEVEAAREIVSQEPPEDTEEAELKRLQKAVRRMRRRYIVSEKLRSLCSGGDSRSVVEEFGLLRRHAREVVILYDEALATGKKDIITDAILEVQEALVDAIAVGATAARLLGPMYDAILRQKLSRLGCKRAMGDGYNETWAAFTLEVDELFGGSATRGVRITP